MSARRKMLTVTTGVMLFLGIAAAAWGFYAAFGFGSGDALATTLASPAPVTAAASGTGAVVSWSAVASPSGTASDVSYTVSRSTDASTWVAASGSCAGTLDSGTTSCTDAPASTGDYYYRVSAAFRSWTSAAQTDVATHVSVCVSATKLTFTSSGQTFVAGSVSDVITVQRQDAPGSPGTCGITTVDLSSSSGAGSFRDADNTQTITTATIAAGSSTATFRYSDTVAGSPTITAADHAAVLAQATQSETVTATTAAVVRVETAANGSGTVVSAQNVTAGTSMTMYSISRDTYGNFVANVASDPSGWSLTSKTGGVADGDLVAATDLKSAVFTGHLVGTAKVHVVKTGLTSTDSGTITVVPGAGAKYVFTSTAQTITASGSVASSAITVQLQDANGNPASAASDTTVSLSTSVGAAGTFRNSADTSSITSVTMTTGTNSVSFKYRSTKAGTNTLTAHTAGLTDGTQAEFVNSAPVTLTWDCPSGAVTKNHNYTVTISVPSDAFGNAFTRNVALAVTLSFPTQSSPAYSVNSSTISITTGPANNTFTLSTSTGANKSATLRAAVGSGFTAPPDRSMTTGN